MLACRPNYDLGNGISRGEICVIFLAQATILDRDLFGCYISEQNRKKIKMSGTIEFNMQKRKPRWLRVYSQT